MSSSRVLLMSAFCFASAAHGDFLDGPFAKTVDEASKVTFGNSPGESCEVQFAATPFCMGYTIEDKDVYISAYALIEKEAGLSDQQMADKILGRYLAFDQWPQYAASSPTEAILEFQASTITPLAPLPDGSKRYLHYFEYTSKAPVIGRFPVIGNSTYTLYAKPKSGALVTADFKNTKTWGPEWDQITPLPSGKFRKGIVGQEAYFDIVAPADNQDVMLVTYRSRVRLSITFGLSVSAPGVKDSLEDILTGMFYN